MTEFRYIQSAPGSGSYTVIDAVGAVLGVALRVRTRPISVWHAYRPDGSAIAAYTGAPLGMARRSEAACFLARSR